MNDATIYSKTWTISLPHPICKEEIESQLEALLIGLGDAFAYNRAILGHIKILAKIDGGEQYVFMSVTRSDHVDVKPSATWINYRTHEITHFELSMNVLLFGYSLSTVKNTVEQCFCRHLGIQVNA